MADYKFKRPAEVQELMRSAGLDPHADAVGRASEDRLVPTGAASSEILSSLESLFDEAREKVVRDAQEHGSLEGALTRPEQPARSE
jgi:hypothetical protein